MPEAVCRTHRHRRPAARRIARARIDHGACVPILRGRGRQVLRDGTGGLCACLHHGCRAGWSQPPDRRPRADLAGGMAAGESVVRSRAHFRPRWNVETRRREPRGARGGLTGGRWPGTIARASAPPSPRGCSRTPPARRASLRRRAGWWRWRRRPGSAYGGRRRHSPPDSQARSSASTLVTAPSASVSGGPTPRT